MDATEQQALKLSVSCRVDSKKLLVEYASTNTSNQPLLTYDGAPGIEAEDGWSNLTGQVYVSHDAVKGVRVMRVRPLQPSDMDTLFVKIPAVYKLAPGETRTVKFSLPLPLTEHSELTPDGPTAKYKTVKVSSLELVVGYFTMQEGTQLRPLNTPNTFKAGGSFGKQQLSAATSKVPLEVRVRQDEGFSRM